MLDLLIVSDKTPTQSSLKKKRAGEMFRITDISRVGVGCEKPSSREVPGLLPQPMPHAPALRGDACY